jgi:hypothetical protein
MATCRHRAVDRVQVPVFAPAAETWRAAVHDPVPVVAPVLARHRLAAILPTGLVAATWLVAGRGRAVGRRSMIWTASWGYLALAAEVVLGPVYGPVRELPPEVPPTIFYMEVL